MTEKMPDIVLKNCLVIMRDSSQVAVPCPPGTAEGSVEFSGNLFVRVTDEAFSTLETWARFPDSIGTHGYYEQEPTQQPTKIRVSWSEPDNVEVVENPVNNPEGPALHKQPID